jgi:hypothetical protein
MIQLARTNGGLCMVITKKYMITCVVWDIMKNIGTCLQKKKLHKVGQKL